MAKKERSKITTTQTALCGVFTAVGVVCLLAGNILPFSGFVAAMLGAMCLVPIVEELGEKLALLCYLAVSLLAVFLVADPECVAVYIFLLGFYPLVQRKINALKSKVLAFIIKCAIYYSAIFVIYAVIIRLLFPIVLQETANEALWVIVCMVLAGNVAFLLFDVLVGRVATIYNLRIKKKR